ncbi:hypothetical protein GCM10011351_07710 [Paraliobacillus quinghaiensis]|uniref:Uncharacterized protein n=1 Tax=Paraliobacillus quinghaiensis TaxID=470815 RepID=A0A917TIS8_9BACI|nr:hypothetical protein [Paraliobacillus quinghaiensis]GGM24411.1 hypothetical protein GCM10011351_07710 [Paraliobacillus quinghaiensis]
MACGQQIENGIVLHNERTAPDDPFSGNKIVGIMDDKDDFINSWDSFNFEKDRPNVDFEEGAIIFAHTTENSCAKDINQLEISDNRLLIDTDQESGPCDDIGYQRTFIIQLDKEKLENVKTVVFENEEFRFVEQ